MVSEEESSQRQSLQRTTSMPGTISATVTTAAESQPSKPDRVSATASGKRAQQPGVYLSASPIGCASVVVALVALV